MRKTTRRKLLAKGWAGGALHTVISDLETAIKEAGKEQPHTPLYNALKRVADNLDLAAKSFDIYNLNRKRLQNQLKAELVRIQALLQTLHEVPITQDDKLAKKRRKA